MFLIDAETAESFLREAGWIVAGEPVSVRELAGGVSNTVLLVHRPARQGENFVLKQARPRLRVADEWLCPVERNWREVEVLRLCASLIENDAPAKSIAPSVPRVLFEDRANFAFAMSAAPKGHATWKSRLMAGRADPAIAAAAGSLLGRIHARTWRDETVAAALDDRSYFERLRLDPYYHRAAEVHADLRTAVERLVDDVLEHRRCLVHGDYSPKNLLVFDGGIMLIDFEVGHYGDPAFDLGFFLAHLVLKAVHHAPRHGPFLRLAEAFGMAYRDEVEPAAGSEEYAALAARAMENLAACLVARVDGKSPVDYLTDPRRRDFARRLGKDLLGQARGGAWVEWAERLDRELDCQI